MNDVAPRLSDKENINQREYQQHKPEIQPPQQTLPKNGGRDIWRNRRRMAYVSLFSIIFMTFLLLFVIPNERIKILSEVIMWFYFSMASVIGSYMGFTTWAYTKDGGRNPHAY